MTHVGEPERATGSRRFAGHRGAVLRVLFTWLVTACTLVAMSAILDGFNVSSWWSALVAAAAIGLLNAVVWPLMIRFALPVTVLTLGLGVLILNGAIVLIVAELAKGVTVNDVFSGVVVAIGITVVNTLVSSLLAIDDDDFYYRNVIRRQARRQGAVASDVPAIVFLEIDGLAHAVLSRALRDGNSPTLARWLRDGSHHLIRWECDWSSQTGAAQTGLLHGTNEDIPAFRWWDKEEGREVSSSKPRDVMAIEQRISNGRGLLHADGASRANMYSGDAPHSLLTMSTVLRRERSGRIGQDYFAYFSNPYSLTRTICLMVGDIVSELWQAGQQKRNDIRPRAHRGFKYSLVRAWTTVVQRDLQVAAVIGDVYSGRPVVYTTFTGYDEVAHHSGIERSETLKILRKLDHQFARIERAARDAPRPVRFVVLSDHGQTQGETFLGRYGETLEQLVSDATNASTVEAKTQGDEGWMFLGASLTEASQGKGMFASSVRTATRGSTVDGEVVLGSDGKSERKSRRKPDKDAPPPEVVVMASGCLGLVFFPYRPGRVSLEWIQERYPALVPTLRDHPGIGFLLVRSERHGAVVIGAGGTNYLDEDRVEGDDPLEPYGPNAARHVKRTDGFPHCGDIMVNSTFWEATDEVAAFEGLVGSHGGMGGEQSFPFALAPSEFAFPDEPVVGPGEMHTWLRRWLADVGQEAYAESALVG
jgi:uncharacterized membrane protein YvlD (DUF360 family)